MTREESITPILHNSINRAGKQSRIFDMAPDDIMVNSAMLTVPLVVAIAGLLLVRAYIRKALGATVACLLFLGSIALAC